MSGDLISREAALDGLGKHCAHCGVPLRGAPCGGCIVEVASEMIKHLPAVGAEPVRHGEWVESKGAIRCSECASTPLYDYHGRIVMSKACPNCGAKMDKEGEVNEQGADS